MHHGRKWSTARTQLSSAALHRSWLLGSSGYTGEGALAQKAVSRRWRKAVGSSAHLCRHPSPAVGLKPSAALLLSSLDFLCSQVTSERRHSIGFSGLWPLETELNPAPHLWGARAPRLVFQGFIWAQDFGADLVLVNSYINTQRHIGVWGKLRASWELGRACVPASSLPTPCQLRMSMASLNGPVALVGVYFSVGKESDGKEDGLFWFVFDIILSMSNIREAVIVHYFVCKKTQKSGRLMSSVLKSSVEQMADLRCEPRSASLHIHDPGSSEWPVCTTP